MSIQGLQQNSPDISAFYLANIFQLLAADLNGSHVYIPPMLSPPSASVSVPKHAVWVNSLWFLSLVISLMCALSATFVRQWADRYIKVTAGQEPHSLHQQARIRAFFAEGVDNSRLPLVVGLIPTFLHLSVFLFLAGLCVFLNHLHPTVFNVVASSVGVCVSMYLCIVVMPILRYNTPYHSPLSSLAWYFWTGMLWMFFVITRGFTALRFWPCFCIRIRCFSYTSSERLAQLHRRYLKRLLDGFRKAAEESAQNLSSEIDGRALVWTARSLDGDDKQERFFANIPAFCYSKALAAPRDAFKGTNGEKMLEVLVGFLHRTESSNLDPISKRRRIDICRKAMHAADLCITWRLFQRVWHADWTRLLNSVEFGLFLRAAKYGGPRADYESKRVIAAIIATTQERDDRWFELATGQLGESRAVLENYSAHGDSVLLANCIDICRRNIRAYTEHAYLVTAAMRSLHLEIVSNFDARNTLPFLQHDFCRLWNQLISMTREGPYIRALAVQILRNIRHVYIALHQGTDAALIALHGSTADNDPIIFFASSYRPCNLPSHIHDVVVDPTGEMAQPPITTDIPLTAPVVLSSSSIAQEPAPKVPGAPQPVTPGAASSHRTPPPLQRQHPSAASPDIPVTAPSLTQGIHDITAKSSTAPSHPLSTPAASTSIPLQVSAPASSGSVTHSVAPASGMSPSFSPTTLRDPSNTSLAGLESFSVSPPIQFDQTPSATAISLAAPQANPNVADLGVPIPVEAPRDQRRTLRSGPDIAIDGPLGAAPFPHDVDRSQ